MNAQKADFLLSKKWADLEDDEVEMDVADMMPPDFDPQCGSSFAGMNDRHNDPHDLPHGDTEFSDGNEADDAEVDGDERATVDMTKESQG